MTEQPFWPFPDGTEIKFVDDGLELADDGADDLTSYLETVFERAGEDVEFEHVNIEFDDDRWSGPVVEFRIKGGEGPVIRLTAVYEDEGEETY